MRKILSLVIIFLLMTVCGCGNTTNTQSSSVDTISSDDVTSTDIPIYTEKDGVYVVENKDDVTTFAIFSDAHIGQSKVHKRNLETAIEWVNKAESVDFTCFLGDNLDNGYYNQAGVTEAQLADFNDAVKLFKKPYFVLKGNHDHAVAEFKDNYVVQCGDVAFIGFFASYYTMDPENILKSNGRVSQFTLKWLEETLAKCKGKRVILACHYSIVVDQPGFTAPIPKAQPVPKRDLAWVDFGREKILELAEQYNIELYFNGHEHNGNMPTGTAGIMTDFNIGSIGPGKVFALVTVDSEKATVELRKANQADTVIKTVEYKFKNSIF
ncbi:MAG: metallophosphoesterase [Acutalibacteraceae bacterium]|nr:metallophosphoesterase [Acutalibacteraceae bacterium]